MRYANIRYVWIGLLLISSTALAQTIAVNPTEPYTQVRHAPTIEQADVLAQTVQVQFPATVQTVGDALNYILRASGYRLTENPSSFVISGILEQPLPLSQRALGPLTLRTALQVLASDAFVLVVDPVYRLIDFELSAPMAELYPKDLTMWVGAKLQDTGVHNKYIRTASGAGNTATSSKAQGIDDTEATS